MQHKAVKVLIDRLSLEAEKTDKNKQAAGELAEIMNGLSKHQNQIVSWLVDYKLNQNMDDNNGNKR